LLHYPLQQELRNHCLGHHDFDLRLLELAELRVKTFFVITPLADQQELAARAEALDVGTVRLQLDQERSLD